jgi:hypothetical protein
MTSRSPGKKTTDKPIRRGGRTLLAYPLALEHWDRHRNGALTPDQVSHGSNRVVWWICRKASDHVWQESAHQRVRSIARGFGCPFCSGRRPSITNSLASLFPQAAAEWHPSRNGKLLPEHVAAHSQKRAWWRCSKNPRHVWSAIIGARTGSHRSGCPYCAGRFMRSLAETFPAIARSWHKTKNGDLSPRRIAPGSKTRVWWQCPKGPDHVWHAEIRARTWNGSGCPFCSGHRVSVTNCLANLVPRLAEQWHPSKNGTLTPWDVSLGSDRRVWWRCTFGHSWPAAVHQRARGKRTGCPFCRRRKQRVARTRRLNVRSG